jgi:hypothetical protein
MNGFRLLSPAQIALFLGSTAGLLAGLTTVALADPAVVRTETGDSQVTIEATHLPPLLTRAGEEVELAYEAFCQGGDDSEIEAPCDVTGTVFARGASGGTFASLPLETVTSAAGRELVATVPEEIAVARGGFEYYAMLTAGGTSITLPAGGASAPHSSLRLERPTVVDLGQHVFGATRRPSARVAEAAWGSGPSEVGLETGRNLPPIGASAFDVDREGNVYVLDEAQHRVLRWDEGSPAPTQIPLSVSGSLADMTVAPDGSIYVLETVAGPGGSPALRRFGEDGRELERGETADRTASQIRMGAGGPVVLQQPSHEWMPVTARGALASAEAQRRSGRVGRPLAAGGDVTVLRRDAEIRVAVTTRVGVRRSWRIVSATPVGEVQLAEPLSGGRLAVVFRAFTDDDSEFVVLVLDAYGVQQRFSVSASEWAESAPLGRFKVAASSLYRLGSSPHGAFVDCFDLEVSS